MAAMKMTKLVGTLNYETGQVFYRDYERYDAPAFIRFFHSVLAAYPKDNNVMIFHKGRIHHAAQVQAYLQKHKVVFLPKYLSDLNLIEGLWIWHKSDVFI